MRRLGKWAGLQADGGRSGGSVLFRVQPDLSAEEAGDPVPKVGLSAAAQVPEGRQVSDDLQGATGSTATLSSDSAEG